MKCGRPQLTLIDFDKSEITQRLTDVNNYPHRHRTRFDSAGERRAQRNKVGKPLVANRCAFELFSKCIINLKQCLSYPLILITNY